MPQTKLSQDQMQKLAAQDHFDREQSFEAGFSKAAKDMGLSDAEFKNFYEIGCKKIAADVRQTK